MGLFDHLYHLDWTARYPLEYYYEDGRHVVFDKYEIDMFGGIYNKKTKRRLLYTKQGEYNMIGVLNNDGKQRNIRVSRAVISTFGGRPPTLDHSTEHIDCTNKDNDIVCELTWMDPSGQKRNRSMPGGQLSSYIIVRNDIEMTAKEWIRHLSNQKNPYDKNYTERMISMYAIRKQNGFSYKVYDNLPDETWYKVMNSQNKTGHWEISDQNRIARVSKHARNVIDSTRFGFDKKYPIIGINGKIRLLHDVAFQTYYPELYNTKLPHEMILHKLDDKLDFRPHMLYIGDASTNGKDSHDNGCVIGTKTSRKPCCSYVNGVFEKLHKSQEDAVKYLKSIGYDKTSKSGVNQAMIAFEENKSITRYDRTWSIA